MLNYKSLAVGVMCMLFMSCIQTPIPDISKRVSILLNVEKTGEQLVENGDTVQVDEIKLLADRINLEMPDGVILQTGVDALVMAYRAEFNGQDENVLSANIGFEDIDQFNGMEIFIDKANNNDNINDGDFFGETTNYSTIITGSYNNTDFEYKSTLSFNKIYDFTNTIQLSNEDETLLLRFTSDIRDIMIDPESGNVLNPNVEKNKSRIDSLLKQSIKVQAQAADLY